MPGDIIISFILLTIFSKGKMPKCGQRLKYEDFIKCQLKIDPVTFEGEATSSPVCCTPVKYKRLIEMVENCAQVMA